MISQQILWIYISFSSIHWRISWGTLEKTLNISSHVIALLNDVLRMWAKPPNINIDHNYTNMLSKGFWWVESRTLGLYIHHRAVDIWELYERFNIKYIWTALVIEIRSNIWPFFKKTNCELDIMLLWQHWYPIPPITWVQIHQGYLQIAPISSSTQLEKYQQDG